MAPIAPFYSEFIFRNLNQIAGTEKVPSVHLTDFPVSFPAAIDEKLEKKMKLAQDISSLVHSLRKKHKIKVRQPLSRILIPVQNSETRDMISDMENLILSEVNIKNIEYIDDASGVLVKKIKPNFKKLGKEYGAQMKDLARAVSGLTQQEISKLEKENQLTLALTSGSKATLTLEDVEISSEDIPGWSVANEHDLTVALDITISDDLRKEGLARDFVNRIQNLRKEMDLDVQDKIRILVQDDHNIIKNAFKSNMEYICAETQALSLEFGQSITDGRKIDMDDLELIIKIET
jgi:isoleucyl-tRNA synthetase